MQRCCEYASLHDRYRRSRMTQRADSDKIELHLVRVLHTLIVERNVSRAAMRLGSTQPAVSAQLKRLRELTGDPLLVRSGNGMQPTATALRLLEPAAALLGAAETLFSPRQRADRFEPSEARLVFRIAASDYLDPGFLPALVARLQVAAPLVQLELLPLSAAFDYRAALADGRVDLVVGNWLQPPGELRLGRLVEDEMVCLAADDHPVVRLGDAAWTVERYLACQHVAPTPLHPGARGVVDDHLASLGLQRQLSVRAAHFGLLPLMVARSRLLLTTGRLFCERYLKLLPVRIVRCPVPFPPLVYYQLWHDLSHAAAPLRWLREQVREAARELAGPANPANPASPGD